MARVVLDCTATNVTATTTEVCSQPYVGARETGALYTTHTPICSSQLEPGAQERIAVHLDVAAETCAAERGGCVVQTIPLRVDGTPEFSSVLGLARALEADAHSPGRDRPAVPECQALVQSWERDPAFSSFRPFLNADRDEVVVFCLGLSRVTFECLRVARSSVEADACSPHLVR